MLDAIVVFVCPVITIAIVSLLVHLCLKIRAKQGQIDWLRAEKDELAQARNERDDTCSCCLERQVENNSLLTEIATLKFKVNSLSDALAEEKELSKMLLERIQLAAHELRASRRHIDAYSQFVRQAHARLAGEVPSIPQGNVEPETSDSNPIDVCTGD